MTQGRSENMDPRESAQKRLEAMVGRGELSLSEFSDRAEKIWAATNPAELDEALSGLDLPMELSGGAAVAPARRPDASSQGSRPAIRVDESGKSTSVFDTIKREGRWRLPDGYKLTSWFGEIFLDAREAMVENQHTRITLELWGATAKVLLPPGVTVEVVGNRTMSELKIDEGQYGVTGGPHLTLEINGFMATAKIKVLEAGAKIPKTWKWF